MCKQDYINCNFEVTPGTFTVFTATRSIATELHGTRYLHIKHYFASEEMKIYIFNRKTTNVWRFVAPDV